jgi:type I restriction enzyme S subunit
MRSNYKRLGDYIEEIKVRNSDLKAKELLGINIDKFFMPSVANIVGTDMSVYKIVKKNQFACNRMHVGRDYRLPISVSKSDEQFMVSPAYDVFEIRNPELLFPEYLMMWFSRREFDRNAWFYTDADVRGGLHWKALCEMRLPIPSITKQREIVKEYNVIQNRIALNQQLLEKLEETAQAIYKQWFVDFEFPDENGLPYKSNGGEMEGSELGEIPKGWDVMCLNDVTIKITDGSHTSPSSTKAGLPMASVKDMHDWGLNLTTSRKISKPDFDKLVISDCKPLKDDILIAKDGSFLKHIFVVNEPEEVVILSSIAIIRPNEKMNSNLLLMYLKLDSTKKRMTNVVNGGAIQRIILKEFKKVLVVVPNKHLQIKASKLIDPILRQCWLKSKENQKLSELKDLLLSKLATIEN